ncbi:MAG: hypothetical protein V1484_00990 [bacterium]
MATSKKSKQMITGKSFEINSLISIPVVEQGLLRDKNIYGKE